MSMSAFTKKVLDAVHTVPYGKVASYGQIALMVGVPRAAQAVGQVLRATERDFVSSVDDAPWWRIINNAGRISIKARFHTKPMQKLLLEKEGIVIRENLTFDIEKYRYRPTPDQLEALKLDDRYVQMIIEKYLI